MTVVALFGAGGKMGMRLGRNLAASRFTMRPVEVSPAGRERVREAFGLACLEAEEAIAGAEVVVLAVPDTHVGAVATTLLPKLAPGTIVVILDAAAPHAGHLPERADITYFVTHPCHPPIFNDETDPAAKADHFGGIAAKQHIVNALMQGPDAHYALGEEVARAIWAPVMRSHRVTVEQMAILEPGLSETVCATLLDAMREAMEEAIARGVPREAARDFLLGHMNILAAVTFEQVQGVFSDACNKAIVFGKDTILKPDWKRLFEPEEIAASVRRIT
ncbi:phosphogluconate dehydrogenase C-terminal domain-containing protein [Bosea sp. (in: a-proteobacteria)]|uniref:phosphogluconate dehydrogenase C-terminal domain-containing protein n=1 Tax=Bosea sp. (in: a-proteobacteria) TaxID=1871050 RepID=UPI002733A937|nr:phosphogluconate dehydrogenase C-terminal domain-containing protein [Bosea sp. (in: a-proteobacteria)]MDP3410973.1 phosphogluconate dehydrogenase C-terminal domain-containing protein [Bosea sp. (in: a-proteobacteria)]